jgi:hypothetical protein
MAQMLLTPYNMLRANVDAPNLTLFRKIVQPSTEAVVAVWNSQDTTATRVK